MTIPIRNSPSGPDFMTDDSVNIDHGAITTKEVLEATGAFADLAQTDGLLVSPRTSSFGVPGVLFSHARFDSAGVMAVGLGNCNAVGQNPGAVDYESARFFRNARAGASGPVIGLAQTGLVVASPGNVGALTAQVLDSGANLVVPTALAVSPRSALAAGFALSHARATGGAVEVTIINLTGGALDPGQTTWDVFALYGPASLGVPVRSAPAGMHMVRRFNAVALNHGSIGAQAVLEASVALGEDVRVGDVVSVQPRAALPTGIAVSHGRVSATGTVQIGLANLSGAPIDPASQTYDLTIFGTNA